MATERILTADGSHSLRSHRFGVTYHSTHGALQESRHIFINHGLLPLLDPAALPPTLRILEMGLGTGLNALLTRQVAAAHPTVQFDYRTYERYPIDRHTAAGLNYCALLGLPEIDLEELHRCSWDTAVPLSPNFTFTKLAGDFLAARAPVPADIIYYDAFAPEDQPELWTESALRHCAAQLRPGGWLLTYCAKGQFKRNLRAAGFSVTALPGPPGKREITRATRNT